MGFSDALPPYPPVYSATGSLPSSPGGSHTSIDLGREHEKRFLAPDADEDDHAPAYDHQRAFEEVTEEEADIGGYGRRSRSQTRRSRLVLLALVSFAILVGLFAAGSWKSPLRPTVKLKKHLDLDLVLNGTFGVQRKQVAWVKEAGDGWFSTVDEDHNIFLENVGTAPSEDFDNEQASEELLRRQTDTVTGNLTRLLVNATWIKDESGEVLQWSDWKLSPDMQYLLLLSSSTPVWRHSSLSTPYLYRFSDNATLPLLSSRSAKSSYVSWSTVGHSLAWVKQGDLYVLDGKGLDSAKAGRGGLNGVRVTNDGGKGEIFNGIPDWVYEEEVFSSSSSLWFSPTSTHIAFLRLNETLVPSFEYPLYDPSTNGVDPYPQEIMMRYPKPGFPNPTVDVFVFSLEHYFDATSTAHRNVDECLKRIEWKGLMDRTDQVVFDVLWVKNGDGLLIKESDRSAGKGNVVLVDVPTGGLWHEGRKARTLQGQVVRELSGEGGWIEQSQYTRSFKRGYLDIIPNEEGWNHLAYFNDPSSPDFVWLSQGEWEVDGGVLAVDEDKALVYFVAATPSTERHVYYTAIPTLTQLQGWEPVVHALTDTTEPGYHAASFSPGAGYWVQNYEGPGIPWQKLKETGQHGATLRVLEENSRLEGLVSDYLMPSANSLTVVVDDVELNVKELRPPNMDETGKTKYPTLLAPYGGPGSQSVSQRFSVGWHEYLTTELKYIVLIVDGRGTGFKSKKVRDPVRGRLGTFEARDQLEVARIWAGQKKYVDKGRIGIWGWSFGGYLTGKVLELGGQEGSEGIFSLGMSVAPVTDWRFYDSVYTERYMLTPETNVQGYTDSAISNMTGFHQADYLLAHGSADDNVHFANTASLLEKLTKDKVRRFESRMFVDSNHRIQTGGAYRELHEWMTRFLRDRWGTGGARRGW